jgi:hypothetical protein
MLTNWEKLSHLPLENSAMDVSNQHVNLFLKTLDKPGIVYIQEFSGFRGS